MKQLQVLGVMLAVLVAGMSVAEEEASAVLAGALNAVVKFEVTTAKPDIRCPLITRRQERGFAQEVSAGRNVEWRVRFRREWQKSPTQ